MFRLENLMFRFKRLGLSVGLLAAAGLALSSAPASAATGYANICGSLTATFCETEHYEIAVDNSTGASAGDVWARLAENTTKLVKYGPAGNVLAEVTEASVPQLSGATRLAVDPADGDLYATNRSEGTLTKLDASSVFQWQIRGTETPQGSFVEPLGVAVDPTNGMVYVADSNHQVIDRFDSNGKYLGQFPVGGDPGGFTSRELVSLAVNAKEEVFVGTENFNEGKGPIPAQVRDYGPTGDPIDCPDGTEIIYKEEAATIGKAAPPYIAVEPSGSIFIAEANATVGPYIAAKSTACGAVQARIGIDEVGKSLEQFGVSEASHKLYAATGSFGASFIFGEVTVPDVTTGSPATNITRTSAEVTGTIDPDETSVTICEFEYGPTTAYGSSQPCSQALPLTGNAPVAVSAELKGLSLPPGSVVHYRLKTGNVNGENVGQDEQLNLESRSSPLAGGQPATNITQLSATLNGTLQTDEAIVNYHFEYGTNTTYGSLAPVPDAYTPLTSETVPVAQPVAGLQPGTTYHYRLVASSPGGTEVKGPDETFTTLPIPGPEVATGGAGGVGVGAATVSGTVDPHGADTRYLFEYGTSTAYGSSWPSVLVDMGSLEGPQPVSVSIPNLLPGTTYHYRLIAVNAGGAGYGPDMTFTTGEYPPSAIQQPPLLTAPGFTFPKEEAGTAIATKALTRGQKLAAALKVCHKKAKGKQAKCEAAARKRFGAVKKAKKGRK
jgi:DNA-binding beta-propeller fold protein YncE